MKTRVIMSLIGLLVMFVVFAMPVMAKKVTVPIGSGKEATFTLPDKPLSNGEVEITILGVEVETVYEPVTPKEMQAYVDAFDDCAFEGDLMSIAKCLVKKGEAAQTKDDHETALWFFRKSWDFFDTAICCECKGKRAERNAMLWMGVINLYIADSLASQKKYDEAIREIEDALELFQETGGKKYQKSALRHMLYVLKPHVDSLKSQKKYDEAIVELKDALILCKRLNNLPYQAWVTTELGSTYFSSENYATALAYFQVSLQTQKRRADKNSVKVKARHSYLLHQIAVVYWFMGKREIKNGGFPHEYFEKARIFFEQALLIIKEIGPVENDPALLRNLGNVYLTRSRYYEPSTFLHDVDKRTALTFYEKSLAGYKFRNDTGKAKKVLQSLFAIHLEYNNIFDAMLCLNEISRLSTISPSPFEL